MSTYVLVHGAWHTGELFEDTAAPIKAAGNQVYLPTITGNKSGDSKSVGLEEAIQSIVDYFNDNQISDAILLGHSYGGMVITDIEIPKSYINCTEDTALPQSLPWHPRLSEKLGLFRLVQTPGSHELCFTNPSLLGNKILEAGRD